MKFNIIISSKKKLTFFFNMVILVLFANIISLKNKSSFLNKRKKTASTTKDPFNWLFEKQYQIWSPVEITLKKKTEKIVLNVELIFHKIGIFIATEDQPELEKIRTGLKNYVLMHQIDDKRDSYLIDFANLRSCELATSNVDISFYIRVFGGTENAKYCETIQTSIKLLPNDILNQIKVIKNACKKRKENIFNTALNTTRVERVENFISQELKKDSTYKEAAEQLMLIKDELEATKKYKELRQRILDEKKETVTDIINTVNEEISKQIILPQEVNLLGQTIVLTISSFLPDSYFSVSLSGLTVRISKGNVVSVSDFKKQVLNYLNTDKDEEKGYLVANVNYNLFPIEEAEFTLSAHYKDGERLSQPLECKGKANVSKYRDNDVIESNKLYMSPKFTCPGRDDYYSIPYNFIPRG